MSRSYRKFPVVKDRCRTSKDRFKPKTYANRAVRRYDDIPTGKSCFFKKIYCSWFISDYRFTTVPDKREFKRQWGNYYPLRYSYIRDSDDYQKDFYQWKKYYIMK
ncbi:MAG: hypothetical protein K2K02_01565 [Ruminococcus sp.]|nr:hypothetical protein [Ruminococcus sp.]